MSHGTQKSQPVARAELGQYPLSINIKVSLLCYWQRLEQKSDNPLLNEISSYLLYARNHRQFYGSLNSDETFTTLVHYKNEAIKISSVLRTLVSALNNRRKLSQDWLKAQNDISDNSRQKDTKKEIKKDHCFEQYLKIVRNPAHRISMTKLRLGVHT